jgi:hypothetical protein
MKLIEGMKEKKYLLRKMEDLRKKIGSYCADLDCMQPTYNSAEEQKKKISEWLQMHDALALNLTTLKKDILRTNLETKISIKIGENLVERSITEWVIRRQEIIDLQIAAYNTLSDRGLGERGLRTMGNIEESKKFQTARVRFYFDASERDKTLDLLKSEKESIDKALEIANAVTEL